MRTAWLKQRVGWWQVSVADLPALSQVAKLHNLTLCQ
jgi:hypothetical protein